MTTGSRKQQTGLRTWKKGMKKFWSGEETRRNKDQHNQRLFRVKAVGSNPTSPTTKSILKRFI